MRKKISGYERYEIDELGNVYNTETNKVMQGSISEHGYRYYRLSKDGKKKMFYGHRLVAEAFIPNPDNLPVINHIDGNKLNNSVTNLEWVSYSENVEKAHQTGLIGSRRKREVYTKDLNGEIWRDIKDFPLYKISNYGRIRNLKTDTILRPSYTCGYYKVRLSNNGLVSDFLVHRLVYDTFCGTYKKGYVIDHIDGNKLNNKADNLRLLSESDNVMASLYETHTNHSAKAVDQYDLNGKYINTYPSTKEAARELHLDSSTISKVCRGVNKTHGGFVFKYHNN